jgi:hypothetical protein
LGKIKSFGNGELDEILNNGIVSLVRVEGPLDAIDAAFENDSPFRYVSENSSDGTSR